MSNVRYSQSSEERGGEMSKVIAVGLVGAVIGAAYAVGFSGAPGAWLFQVLVDVVIGVVPA